MGTIRSTMSDREKLSDVVMSSLEGEMDVEAVEHAFADAKAAAARLRAEGKEEEAADLNQMVDCLEGAVEAHLMAEDLQKEAAAMARGDTASVPNRTCTTHEPVTHMDYSIRGNPMTVTLQEAPADEHIDGGDPSSWAPVSASCMDRMVRQPEPELPYYSGPILDADGNQIAFIEPPATLESEDFTTEERVAILSADLDQVRAIYLSGERGDAADLARGDCAEAHRDENSMYYRAY